LLALLVGVACLSLRRSHLASRDGSMLRQQQTDAVTALSQRGYIALMVFDDPADRLHRDIIPLQPARSA